MYIVHSCWHLKKDSILYSALFIFCVLTPNFAIAFCHTNKYITKPLYRVYIIYSLTKFNVLSKTNITIAYIASIAFCFDWWEIWTKNMILIRKSIGQDHWQSQTVIEIIRLGIRYLFLSNIILHKQYLRSYWRFLWTMVFCTFSWPKIKQ